MLVADRAFLANHARVLLCLAHNPGVRLPGIAASLDITERSAYGIVTGLAEAGRIVKPEERPPQPLPEPRHTCRRQNPPGGHPPSAKSWPSWPEPAQAC
jgi:hypothetical protein